jgi:hypothetical protein
VQSRLPSGVWIPIVEWRARRIADPVERLRFLRRSATPVRGGSKGIRRWLVLSVLTVALAIPMFNFSMTVSTPPVTAAMLQRTSQPGSGSVNAVWQVERNREYEVYSNGLRIENRFQTPGAPRRYGLIDRKKPDAGFEHEGTEPVGIVFHTTESELAPFSSDQNRTLQKLGMSLLEYVRRERSYNFVIDRFGRVFRIVAENETANHAGHSIWADANWFYVNLNQSFIGISFEAQSVGGRDATGVSPAQFHAAKVLTEMLRSRYGIAAGNCVTHAQVSVNPDNMRIGYHTDWAGNFPFSEMGLPDNYNRPLPSMYAFGFVCDPAFVNASNARMWIGVALAEQETRQSAMAAGMTVPEYCKALQQRYRKELAALRASSAQEKSNEN